MSSNIEEKGIIRRIELKISSERLITSLLAGFVVGAVSSDADESIPVCLIRRHCSSSGISIRGFIGAWVTFELGDARGMVLGLLFLRALVITIAV